MNLKDHNGGICSAPTITVSTVSLPFPIGPYGGKKMYETCVFHDDGSDVVERYETAEEAIQGHQNHCRKYLGK